MTWVPFFTKLIDIAVLAGALHANDAWALAPSCGNCTTVQEALTLADRVLLIENGRLTLDLAGDLPRAGRRGAARFAALEQQVLARVLAKPGQ